MTDGASKQTTLASANLAEALSDGEIEAVEKSGLWQDKELLEAVAYLQSVDPRYEDSLECQTIQSMQVSETLRKGVQDGNPSVMQHGTGYVSHRTSEEDALPILVGKMETHGATIYIWGGQGDGKSHATLWFADKALKFVDDIETAVTNIPVANADLEIHPDEDVDVRVDGESVEPTPEDMASVDRETEEVSIHVKGSDATEELREASVIQIGRERHAKAVCAVVEDRVMFGLDEWGTKGGGSKGSDPHKSEKMMQFVKEMRHRPYRAVGVFVGHSPTDLSKDGRSVLDLGIQKPTKTLGKLYGKVRSDGGEGHITDVEFGAHGLDYDDEGSTRWRFESDEEDEESGEVDEEEIRKREMVRIALRMRDNEEKQKDVADALGMSRPWVSKIEGLYELDDNGEVMQKRKKAKA